MDPNQQSTPYRMPQMPIPRSKKGLFISVGIIAVLVVIIGMLSFLLFSRNSSPTSREAQQGEVPDNNPLMATVGNQKIYKSTVAKAAAEQYDPNRLSDAILDRYLDIVIERAILGIEASRLNISVTPEDIKQYKIEHPQEKNDNTIKYQIFKDKIMEKQVRNYEAYVLTYWATPLDQEQKPEDEQVRTDGKQALTEAETRIRNKDNPFTIAKDLYNKYPSLQKSLALNGYILNGFMNNPTGDTSMFVQPKVYALNPKDVEALSDPEFYNALFTMKTGDIKRVQPNSSSGESLIYVINSNSEGFASYEDFLAAREKDLVTKYE